MLNVFEIINKPIFERGDTQKHVKLHGFSLLLFGPKDRFRNFCASIVLHPYFDPFIMVIIIISTIMMIIDNPLNDPNGRTTYVLSILDFIITTIFCLESALKIIHYGFLFNGVQSYLKISWNIMDFVIVCFSILSLMLSTINIPFIKVLRLLRVLRPLRVISRNESLKIAVISLINAIPSVLNAIIIALIFFLLFSIFSTIQFKGKLFVCNTSAISPTLNFEMTPATKWDCLANGGDWVNNILNYDNVLNSFVCLFVLSSGESW